MEKLRQIRKEKGITMKQLGAEVGVTEASISFYETGKRQPDIETLRRIAKYLQVSVDCLVGNDKPTDNQLPSLCPPIEKAASPLSEKETRLIAAFNELIPSMQDYAIEMLEKLVESQQPKQQVVTYKNIKGDKR